MLLTILVPTNTIEYLDTIANKFIEWRSHNTQLIFAINGKDLDNCFLNLLNRYSKTYNIKIINTKSDNIVDSINFVLPMIESDYVTFIGNDDLFMYEMETLASYALKYDIDAIKYSLNLIHFWDNTKKNASLTIQIKKNKKINMYDLSDGNAIRKLLDNAGQGYINYPLVNFYHGLVRTSLLHELYRKTGTYFNGFSPDIYFAVSLSYICKRVLVLNMPFSIPGIGKSSASYEVMNKTHQSRFVDSNAFSYSNKELWPRDILPLFNVQTTWAVSMMIALDNLGYRFIKPFNYRLLNLYQFLYNSVYRNTYGFRGLLENISITNTITLFKHFSYLIYRKIRTTVFSRTILSDISIDNLEKDYVELNKKYYDRIYAYISRYSK
jgi:hypothetical protein